LKKSFFFSGCGLPKSSRHQKKSLKISTFPFYRVAKSAEFSRSAVQRLESSL